MTKREFMIAFVLARAGATPDSRFQSWEAAYAAEEAWNEIEKKAPVPTPIPFNAEVCGEKSDDSNIPF